MKYRYLLRFLVSYNKMDTGFLIKVYTIVFITNVGLRQLRGLPYNVKDVTSFSDVVHSPTVLLTNFR